MIDIRTLMKTKTFWLERIRHTLFAAIDSYMERKSLNRTELANELGCSKGYISQVLNGNFNHKLEKLVELSLAVGLAPKIEFTDLDQVIEERMNKYTVQYHSTTIPTDLPFRASPNPGVAIVIMQGIGSDFSIDKHGNLYSSPLRQTNAPTPIQSFN
ncbi:MAG: helix-turn-helix transcriptional regulator [Candidatus Marinimicrobia bacterium]|jgi:transcriptional regulator with XRE-family HTH domain|nr:helix-turn-helix transcriptional regulator [Candidatus Neomarinimicrobiota bacterium]MBT3634837.1 helix-turn-helix transcriptional regulator [Candidatus Neomarinimicrobiota bacterium]MBT3683549.1 helix-turn-helix transcriptional regulator [Candidatus Neomarinimicrobiota bacterium]MBT3760491.1 helix-turn-helix transcriptional regulator [Candidatus Neomarinimicrobiota bacterium]MBT3896637.1 helix-turn-helix transcriptional regulator [Candidatus Neomarinimicrobiota bacterium]